MQDEVDLAVLEAPGPTDVQLVSFRCEAQACTAAAEGILPIELVSAAGKKAGSKRRDFCLKRADALAATLSESAAARADLDQPQIKAVVIALCFFKACTPQPEWLLFLQ